MKRLLNYMLLLFVVTLVGLSACIAFVWDIKSPDNVALIGVLTVMIISFSMLAEYLEKKGKIAW